MGEWAAAAIHSGDWSSGTHKNGGSHPPGSAMWHPECEFRNPDMRSTHLKRNNGAQPTTTKPKPGKKKTKTEPKQKQQHKYEYNAKRQKR